MKSLLNRFTPKTIASQLMTLLVIVLVFAQIVNLFIIVGERRIQARANIFHAAMNKTIQIIQELPQNKPPLPFNIRNTQDINGIFFLSRENIALKLKAMKPLTDYEKTLKKMLNDKNIQYQSLSIILNTAGSKTGKSHDSPQELNIQRPNKRPNGRLHPRHPEPRFDHSNQEHPNSLNEDNELAIQELIISVEVRPNIWLNALLPHYSIEALTPRILIATSILLALTLLTAWFFILRISKPLSTLTLAAEKFGRGGSSIFLKESGPSDIRLATQAFNTMQQRLSRMLETQRTMLRAVGHDLRTPLTSLRLRSELLTNDREREKFIETINDMTLMTEEILNWAKNASGIEEVKPVDLHALLVSIVDDFADQGRNIELKNFNRIVLPIRPVAIKRALLNVIGNALKYGKQARISVEQNNQHIDIHIDDQGPGIPEHLIGDALKPFVRLEESRNKQTGGTGLGLSIAKTIVEAEGGMIMLSNMQTKGLRATICLPENTLS